MSCRSSVWAATALALTSAVASGCAHTGSGLGSAGEGALRDRVALLQDPTVRGARLVPEALDDEKPLGTEPGGGVRGIASGVRVVTLPSGAVLAAEDRLPQAPRTVTALPDRLGGGFLFVLGSTVWRASSWLGRAKPLYVASAEIAQVVVGLDRVYLRWPSGATEALDPRTGASLDLGPWPPSPNVGAYAALDGWRAVAVADLRGVVATFDAGATWAPLGIPTDARELRANAEGVLIGGSDAAHKTAWYMLRPDGQLGRVAPPTQAPADERTAATDPLAKSFGKRPLLAAIEDGWPLADGTALVARDGVLARIRLGDGAIVDLEGDAFPIRPARCHPIAVGPRTGGGFGFVCGEPRGRTGIYTFDAAHGRLAELRTFTTPRLVLASGNGALAVRGGCDTDAPADASDTGEQSYCLFPLEGAPREVRLRGTLGGERLIVLGDGRLAVVSPPHGDLGAARLTVLDHDHATTRPVVFPPLSPEITRVVRGGMWLDGFYEKRPGLLAGWVESQGTMLGVEIDLQGTARAGAFVRDAGATFVSGPYGLGWTGSRHGYETTDGGATWTPVDLPEPITRTRGAGGPVERACGPIGCVLAGWLRVGWGATETPPPSEPATATTTTRSTRQELALDCEPVRGAPLGSAPEIPILTRGDLLSPWGSFGRVTPAVTTDWSSLYGVAPPTLHADELGMSVQTSHAVESTFASGPLARLYAWGAKGTEWDHTSRWLVRWIDPFGSSLDVRSSATVPAPRVVVESSRFATGTALRPVSGWSLDVADDPRYALLVARRGAPSEVVLTALEAERAPVEVHRGDGEPFPDLESAVRLGGHWYVATSESPGELPASVVWTVEGGMARELARVPRAGTEGRGAMVRLARRSDGRALGIVVDGQPSAARSVPRRWVVGVDVETGAVGAVESLGDADLADRAALGGCTGDEPGWIVDVPWSGTARVTTAAGTRSRVLRAAHTTLRLSQGSACVEQLAGTLDGGAEGLARAGRAPVLPRGEAKHIDVSAYVARARFSLRCVAR